MKRIHCIFFWMRCMNWLSYKRSEYRLSVTHSPTKALLPFQEIYEPIVDA